MLGERYIKYLIPEIAEEYGEANDKFFHQRELKFLDSRNNRIPVIASRQPIEGSQKFGNITA